MPIFVLIFNFVNKAIAIVTLSMDPDLGVSTTQMRGWDSAELRNRLQNARKYSQHHNTGGGKANDNGCKRDGEKSKKAQKP